jgi:hypothetical protein
MPEINLIDPAGKNFEEALDLSLQLSPAGFTFCIHSSGDKQIRAFRHYKFIDSILEEDMLNNTSHLLQKDDLLRLKFNEVKVMYMCRKSTLVPSRFARKEYLKRILEFNQPLDDLDEIHQNLVANCDSQLVFAIPTYFAGLITDKFKNAGFYNQAIPLLTYSLSRMNEPEENMVYLQLNKEFFDIVIIKEKRLTLYNTFLYVNSTDLLYFILYACRQLKIDTKHTPFQLMGERSLDADLLKELRNYIPTLRTFEKMPSIPFTGRMKLTLQQQYHGLIHLHLCE